MREEFSFVSADGRTKIHGVRWRPEGQPRCAVQLVHGMMEHIDRYAGFAEFLNGHGVLVVGHDHLGHGDSVTSPDEMGYFDRDNPCGVLLEDMHAVRLLVQKQNPGLPYFMLGHSMGSYLLRKYLVLHGEGLAGAGILGTGYVPPAVAGVGLGVCRAVALFRGWHHRSSLLVKLTMGGGAYKHFDSTGKEPARSWLTRDVAVVERYARDPRCGVPFTLNGYRGLLQAVRFSCRPANIEKLPADLPLLVISGEQDPVGDLGTGVRKVDAMIRAAGVRDVTLKLYPEDRHEVLNELNRDEVYADIYDWLEAHLPHGGETDGEEKLSQLQRSPGL